MITYISHGGGPLPILGEPSHANMRDVLKNIAAMQTKPHAILVVSAHWEMPEATLTASASPSLYYDYGGFPPESYQITYPVAGAPDLAQGLGDNLRQQGITARFDMQRGLDHGVFIPLKIMYPAANIPCLQISLLHNLDAARHIALGTALAASVTTENLLLIGSGFSFHNFKAFFSRSTAASEAQNLAFEDWLIDTCRNSELTEAQRAARLINWASAPGARYCHPREEHLLPLHVCYGAAQKPATRAYRYQVMGKWASAYVWD